MLSARSFSRRTRLPKQCHYCLCQVPTAITFPTTSIPTSTPNTTTVTSTTNNTVNTTLIPIRSAHHFRRRTYPKEKKYAIFKGLGPIPPYPYGPSQWFKQSNRALYGGARVTFGNNVSDKFEIKTRRRWRLNSQRKRLYSKALDRLIRVRVTVKVLRTIEKVGGLDEYLLGHKPARIKGLGPRGWALRWRLMQEPSVQERIRRERREMGIVDDADNDADDPDGGGENEAVKTLRTDPETLAKRDYERIIRDKNGKLLGTEPGRWRLLHVLYMRRLKKEKEIIARLEAEGEAGGGASGGANGEVTDGTESEAKGRMEGANVATNISPANAVEQGNQNNPSQDSSTSNAIAKEIKLIDEALDAEDDMTDEDMDREETEDINEDDKVLQEDKKKKQKLKRFSSTKGPEEDNNDDNMLDAGNSEREKNMSWDQKRARMSKGPVEVHPDVLEAAERGEQPRSSI